MILSCVADGHALNTIKKVCNSNRNVECGYKAWIALKDWYLDPTQFDSMISHWESRLESTVLDVDTSATEYINNFEMYVRKLMKIGENWTDDKKVREFKKSVSDPDYNTEVHVHKGKFAKLVETVRKREQDLGCPALESSRKNKRTRRVKFGEDDELDDKEPRKANKKKNKETPRVDKSSYVPFMPKFVFATFNSKAKTNFSKWRQLTNQGETMEKKHLETSSDEVVKDAKKPFKKTGKKNSKLARRVTRTCRVGIQDDVVQIKLTSSDEEYIRTIFSESTKAPPITVGDDSNYQDQLDHSNDD